MNMDMVVGEENGGKRGDMGRPRGDSTPHFFRILLRRTE